MTVFRHPAFARLSPKIDRAVKELRELEGYAFAHEQEVAAGGWGAMSAISLGIHNVYNGMEDVLLSLAKDIDGLVPTGPTMHQDVLDQMSAEIAGIRPPVLATNLYEDLMELKGFRHLVRHRYGFDLKAEKVQENLERARRAFPLFVEAITSLEDTLLKESTQVGDGSGGRGSPGS